MNRQTRDLQEGLHRIFLLVNLLYSRRIVSMKTIREVCGLPERTAYRYLNIISQANIPVYYDRQAGGYRVRREGHVAAVSFTSQESAILLMLLRLLWRSVCDCYRPQIREAETKILLLSADSVEEILPEVDHYLDKTWPDVNLPDYLTSILLSRGLTTSRRIRVSAEDADGEKRMVELENPSLEYRDGWYIVENRDSEQHRRLLLAQIESVELL